MVRKFGRRRHRRIVLGSIDQITEEPAARKAVAALQLAMNRDDVRMRNAAITMAEAYQHFRQRELNAGTSWRTYSTRMGYQGYLDKWVMPRWGQHTLVSIQAGEVELWMRSLPLARSTCAKIRNAMSVLFNHAIRHGICNTNPIQLVRQSAKRRKIPLVLTPQQIQSLIAALPLRERTLIFLAAGTGLRMSELFALKWQDIHFENGEISIIRSIVMQVVGPCKTEASQKPIPMDSFLAQALKTWQEQSEFASADDWVSLV